LRDHNCFVAELHDGNLHFAFHAVIENARRRVGAQRRYDAESDRPRTPRGSCDIDHEVEVHLTKRRFRAGELDRGAECDEYVIHRRERCGQPREVDFVKLQLGTDLDVRRRSAQQDVQAAVTIAREKQ